MRILYDGQIYSLQKVGGISRYFDNLISRLPKNYHPTLTTVRSRQEPHPYHPNLKLCSYKRFGFRPGRVCYWLEPHYFRTVEILDKPQIFHPTYYSLLSRRELTKNKYPMVLTVHDMIHEVFANLMDKDGQVAEIKRNAILAADVILCVSENTKKDLLTRYSLPEERIYVTHLATDFSPNIGYGNEIIPTQPFFLHVGWRNNYKNFSRLLIAFSKITFKVPDIILCVVGTPFDIMEEKLIYEMNLGKHIQHFSFASDAHLAKLYRNCIAFVYPSLYEGFGIPPLEAMICQAPVIASDSSSIPEVVGDAGLLFEPTSISDLTDKLLFLLENPAERERMIAKGLQQSQKFSWDKTVSQTIQAYQYVVN
ncbi:glycosyltransferase family 4 protein [Nostoc sp. MS1]|uniref:glycosyltransferase family 4 protein n=1 Tax=Nostoc sp. MS1 TaxID=2764711 RepID=UPI001CC3FE17|nr:glycosyltransferase family 1 protein [Nostoc sp. MS1]BCL35201.1 glycosyl transferase [Nostoc sp. MS1]